MQYPVILWERGVDGNSDAAEIGSAIEELGKYVKAHIQIVRAAGEAKSIHHGDSLINANPRSILALVLFH